MKKTIFAATAAIVAMAALPAAAQGWYAQVNAGSNVASNVDASGTVDDGVTPVAGSVDLDLNNGFDVGAAAGYSMPNGLRLEGEAFYTTNDIDGIKVAGTAVPTGGMDLQLRHMGFFLNALYDFQMDSVAQPYVGAGVGYGSMSLDIDNDSAHDEGLAWQLKAGVAFPVNDSLLIDVGYRYIKTADYEWAGDIDASTTGAFKIEPEYHVLTVGARMPFGGGAE